MPASEVGRCSIRLQTNERGNPNGYLMDCPSARIEVPLTTSNLSRLLDKVRELSGRDLPWTEIPTAGEIAGSFSPRQMLVKQLNSRAFTTFGTAAGIMLAEVIGGKAHWDMRTLSWVLFPSLVYMLIARVRRANERLVIDEDGVRYVNPFGFATFRVAWQDIEPGTMSWSFDEIDSAFYAVYRVRINGRVIRWDTAMPNCEKLCIRVRRFAQQPWLPLPQDSIPGFGGADGRTVTA